MKPAFDSVCQSSDVTYKSLLVLRMFLLSEIRRPSSPLKLEILHNFSNALVTDIIIIIIDTDDVFRLLYNNEAKVCGCCHCDHFLVLTAAVMILRSH